MTVVFFSLAGTLGSYFFAHKFAGLFVRQGGIQVENKFLLLASILVTTVWSILEKTRGSARICLSGGCWASALPQALNLLWVGFQLHWALTTFTCPATTCSPVLHWTARSCLPANQTQPCQGHKLSGKEVRTEFEPSRLDQQKCGGKSCTPPSPPLERYVQGLCTRRQGCNMSTAGASIDAPWRWLLCVDGRGGQGGVCQICLEERGGPTGFVSSCPQSLQGWFCWIWLMGCS